MPFRIIQNDITKMNTDAIVNTTNIYLVLGTGVSEAIYREAGEELQNELQSIGRCELGKAVITNGYNLKAKYIIHTVGPVWKGGNFNESFYLKNAYMNSLLLAKQNNIKSISFPLISSGNYGYPKEEALEIAVSTIKKFLKNNEMDINLVVYDRKAIAISRQKYTDITDYIEAKGNGSIVERKYNQEIFSTMGSFISLNGIFKNNNLEKILNSEIETFHEMLFRIIESKGMTEVEVYKKANIDRRLFSKIKNNKNYKTKKTTAISLAIALELSIGETNELLYTLGYILSKSQRFDLIIMYFIEHKEYDIFKINEALFEFQETLLVV